MTIKRIIIKGLRKAGVLCMAALFTVPVYADNQDDLSNLQDEQNRVEQEQGATGEKLRLAQEKVDEVTAAVHELDDQISELGLSILELDGQIEDNLKQLDKTKQDLEVARDEEVVYYGKLKKRIKIMYETGNDSYIEVLLTADSIASLLTKAEYAKKLAEYDHNIMTGLTEVRNTIEEDEALIVQKEAELEANRASQEAKKEELMEAQAEKEAQLEDLKSDADALELYMAQLDAERNAVIAEISAKEAEIEAERIAAEEERRRQEKEERRKKKEEEKQQEEESEEDPEESEEDPEEEPEEDPYEPEEPEELEDPEPFDGSYSWPVSGYTHLSCYFGEADYIYGMPHRGIDIPAPAGTSINACAGGTVVTAGWNNSWGNYVAISHGNGMVTLYAHCSALYVSAGQSVSGGQSIAAVGNTGDSLGNHLHLEFSMNGSLVDPLGYL